MLRLAPQAWIIGVTDIESAAEPFCLRYPTLPIPKQCNYAPDCEKKSRNNWFALKIKTETLRLITSRGHDAAAA